MLKETVQVTLPASSHTSKPSISAHGRGNYNPRTISLVKSMGTECRKRFLTGPPFESSSAQIAGWVDTLDDGI